MPRSHAIAAGWRARFDPLVVGVTGQHRQDVDQGAIADVLATRFRTLSNEGNQNNEVGLPLTVLRLGPEHEAAVLEMGMYVGGEIADLARIGAPVDRRRDRRPGRPPVADRLPRAIERGKGELVEALPADGTAVLNADDPRVARHGRSDRWPAALTYGFADDADVRAAEVESAGLAGMRFTLVAAGERRP